MRVAALLILISSLACCQEWQSLFDGETLNGWHVEAKAADREKEFWTVTDGSIQCDSLARKDHNYVWLIRDGEFSDFELQLEVRDFPESRGNSGVQVRSRWDAAASWLHGPQVDIHPPGAWRSGLIYDETRETRRWIYPSLPDSAIVPAQGPQSWKWFAGVWNTIQIVCLGGRITTRVNGVVITDQDLSAVLFDEAHQRHKVGRQGQIALQLHAGDELKIQYRHIRIRELL